MFKLFVIRFWPIWVPLLLYVLWWKLRVHRARKTEEEIPAFTDGPWLWTIALTLLLAMAMFIWLGLSGDTPGDTPYEPARMEDGKIIRP